jgi:hypothetical protein
MRRPPVTGTVLAAAAVLALTACGGSSTPAATSSGAGAAIVLPAPLISFAGYNPAAEVGPDSPAYAGPSTPHSLEKVSLVRSERDELKQVPALAPLLEKQGFGVVRSGSSLFQDEYEGNRYGGFPVYVTTDAAYNTWHLVFDKTLRDLEQKMLLPKLEQLVGLALRNARIQADAAGGGALDTSTARVVQLYEVAEAELGGHVTLGPLARQEKALIDAHDAKATSPLAGANVDYSLFAPRGHYTLSADLKRFFVTMSVLGQSPFCLPGTRDCDGVESARLGILASLAITSDPEARALWQQIYEPTAFLVGLSDDYTPGEVAAAVAKVAPSVFDQGVKALIPNATVSKITKALVATRPVRIDPERASIRLMGTRFVIDSYLLDQLVSPNVGTGAKPRLLPSALDLASAFGSKLAADELDRQGVNDYANYGSQLAAVRDAVAARKPVDWGATVYDAWLYALQPVFAPHGKSFPDYMRSNAWAAKDLQAGLGSYTELKHDTILFAKQLVAEAGGDFTKQNPLNWVEPDPAAFERLAACADLLRQGLKLRGLLSPEAGGLLTTEARLLGFLGTVARGELAGRTLAEADNQRLRDIGGELSAIWWRTSERANPDPSIPDQSAVVADIASGPGAVLELGTGEIDTLYVLVPGRNGTFELARGGVYSYYEFKSPPGVRLTDEAWRAMLASGKAPPRPAWESVFQAPCPHQSRGCSPSYRPG